MSLQAEWLDWATHLNVQTLFVKNQPSYLLSHLVQAQRVADKIQMKCEMAGISANSVPAWKVPQFL